MIEALKDYSIIEVPFVIWERGTISSKLQEHKLELILILVVTTKNIDHLLIFSLDFVFYSSINIESLYTFLVNGE